MLPRRCTRSDARERANGEPCAAAVVAVGNNCTPSGPPEGGAPPRGWGRRCRVVPARCAVTAAVPHNGHGTAQWRGSDSNRRSPGYGPGEDSAPPPRSMRRGFTRSGAPGAASAPTRRRSAAVVVVVVVRMYETTFVCTYRQDLRKRRARPQECGTIEGHRPHADPIFGLPIVDARLRTHGLERETAEAVRAPLPVVRPLLGGPEPPLEFRDPPATESGEPPSL